MGRKTGKKLTDKRRAKTPKRPQPKETQAQLRKVSANRLKQILAAHKKWLETKGKHGNQAHLPGANLQRANLQKAHLEEANLQKADLRADLQGANLTEVKGLSEATLQNANLDSYQEPFIDTILVV